MYNGRTEPMLVSVSDSYSEDEIILVYDNRPSRDSRASVKQLKIWNQVLML